jgi:DNA-directed RNA polymerase subunit beta
MPWQGYNFEDAILINERLVYDDILLQFILKDIKLKLIEIPKLPNEQQKIFQI